MVVVGHRCQWLSLSSLAGGCRCLCVVCGLWWWSSTTLSSCGGCRRVLSSCGVWVVVVIGHQRCINNDVQVGVTQCDIMGNKFKKSYKYSIKIKYIAYCTRHGFLTPATRRSPFTLPWVNPYLLSRVGVGQGKGQGHAGVTLGLPVTITSLESLVQAQRKRDAPLGELRVGLATSLLKPLRVALAMYSLRMVGFWVANEER